MNNTASSTVNKKSEKQSFMKIEDLPDNMQEIAKLIGMEPTLKLIKMVGGEAVYFPTLTNATRRVRNRAIRSEFNGCNYKDLAKKYNLTNVGVRGIINRKQ